MTLFASETKTHNVSEPTFLGSAVCNINVLAISVIVRRLACSSSSVCVCVWKLVRKTHKLAVDLQACARPMCYQRAWNRFSVSRRCYSVRSFSCWKLEYRCKKASIHVTSTVFSSQHTHSNNNSFSRCSSIFA